MSLVVNTNVSALIAQRNLGLNAMKVQRSLERLSSGFRINRAGDDAAGLTISENLIGQVRGSKRALQNAQDGVSILDIAEGALSVIGENLQRMRELTVQAANDTNSQTQRNAIARELRARADDIDRIANATTFNGINLLDGSAANARLQIGANSTLATNTIDITAALANAQNDLDSGGSNDGLRVIDAGGTSTAGFTTLNSIYNFGTGTTAITTATIARNFLVDLDTAINTVTSRRSTIGSFQNQLESVIGNLQLAIENFTASNSRIRDLDIASESSALVQNQILQQAAVSVLSQANSNPQLTLQLLQSR